MKGKIYLKRVKKNRICCNDENGNKCFFLFNSVHPCLKRYIQCESEHIIFLQVPKPPTIVKWGKGSGSITLSDARCQVNDRFNHRNGIVYVIKGAWSGRYPDKSTCFMMRENGIGHAYAGIATPVKDVWNITEEEFSEICGGHPQWFKKIC